MSELEHWPPPRAREHVPLDLVAYVAIGIAVCGGLAWAVASSVKKPDAPALASFKTGRDRCEYLHDRHYGAVDAMLREAPGSSRHDGAALEALALAQALGRWCDQ